MADAYRVLNVSPSASLSTIRRAYLELACQHHPCKLSDQQVITSNTNHTQFRLAAEAYALVGDDSRRELYDLIKSSEFFRHNAGRYVPEDEGSLGQERHGTAATGRSRARSELTIDLRAGLPPELRAFLVDLDPVKVFNRVVCQIDQERRAEVEVKKRLDEPRLGSSPGSSGQSKTNTKPAIVPQSKYLSPPSRFLDEEGSFSRTGNTKILTSGTAREDNGGSKQPQPLSGATKTGILRDESKSRFRQSPSSLSELLSCGDHSEPYQSSLSSEFNRESIRSSGGYSTSSSSYNISHSASPSRGRNNRSRRVSFSNDVIESDQIKLAREAVKSVKSFKPETARSGSKPILTNSSNSSRHSASSSVDVNSSNLRGLVNKFGLLNTQGSNAGAPLSSYKKPNEFFLDKSLYSDFCSPIDSIPQDILVKSIGIPDSSRDSRGLLSSTAQPRSSHSQQLMGQKMDGHYRDRDGQAGRHDFLAASAPTGFLSRYRTHQDLILDKNLSHYQHQHHHHHHTLPYVPLLLDQVHHPFPWSDPNFDNPRSIPFSHECRDAN